MDMDKSVIIGIMQKSPVHAKHAKQCSTPYSAHCTLCCKLQTELYTSHCTAHCKLYCTLHTVLHTANFTLHTEHCPGNMEKRGWVSVGPDDDWQVYWASTQTCRCQSLVYCTVQYYKDRKIFLFIPRLADLPIQYKHVCLSSLGYLPIHWIGISVCPLHRRV